MHTLFVFWIIYNQRYINILNADAEEDVKERKDLRRSSTPPAQAPCASAGP